MEVKPGFREQKKCPFSLNRDVPMERFHCICNQPRWPAQFIPQRYKRGSRELTFHAFTVCQPSLFLSLS